jgi:hypothetical protein
MDKQFLKDFAKESAKHVTGKRYSLWVYYIPSKLLCEEKFSRFLNMENSGSGEDLVKKISDVSFSFATREEALIAQANIWKEFPSIIGSEVFG